MLFQPLVDRNNVTLKSLVSPLMRVSKMLKKGICFENTFEVETSSQSKCSSENPEKNHKDQAHRARSIIFITWDLLEGLRKVLEFVEMRRLLQTLKHQFLLNGKQWQGFSAKRFKTSRL